MIMVSRMKTSATLLVFVCPFLPLRPSVSFSLSECSFLFLRLSLSVCSFILFLSLRLYVCLLSVPFCPSVCLFLCPGVPFCSSVCLFLFVRLSFSVPPSFPLRLSGCLSISPGSCAVYVTSQLLPRRYLFRYIYILCTRRCRKVSYLDAV